MVFASPDTRLSEIVRPAVTVRDSTTLDELENLFDSGIAIAYSALMRKESRGAHSRPDHPDRDDENWMKHSLASIDDKGKVTLSYRPVHSYTLTDEAEYIKPQARVY